MSTQMKNGSRRPLASKMTGKLHSIHVLPDERNFDGLIEFGGAKYQFTFAPKAATIQNRKLTLTGDVTVISPRRQKRIAEKVEATLLATQGSTNPMPPFPRSLDPSLKPGTTESARLPGITDATGPSGSVGVMYFRLSDLKGQSLGVPMEMSGVQLNVRLYSTSEIERDLQWIYSALVRATLSDPPNDDQASAYLAELNRILKVSSS